MASKHRIYTDLALEPGKSIILLAESAHYLARVLRAVAGQTIVLFNGNGLDYPAEITGFRRDAVQLDVHGSLPARPESPLQLTLVQAVSRGERMDLSLQKATELGVMAFQPVFSARTEVRLTADKALRRMNHWRKVIVSACEQSGRACLPALHEPTELLQWMQAESPASRVVLVPGASCPLAGLSVSGALELAVGPEGGFETFELDALERQGVLPVSLGPRILRTETAGPAAVAILQALAGDFG